VVDRVADRHAGSCERIVEALAGFASGMAPSAARRSPAPMSAAMVEALREAS